jgi:peptide/nickel transport system permease protein
MAQKQEAETLAKSQQMMGGTEFEYTWGEWSRRQLAFWRNNKMATIGLIIVLTVIVVAILAPVIAPHDPYERNMANRIASPSLQHPFGTDSIGRDSLSRIMYGARISLMVGFISVGIATIIGVPLGLLAGYSGGRPDSFIMRIMDTLITFPDIVLAIAILAILGPSIFNAMIAIGIVYIPIFARTARAPTMGETNREYVEAARALGAGVWRIVFRHVAPNILSVVIVRITVSFSYAILAEAALSFLGLSASPPTPTWGRMLNEGRGFMELAPYVAIFPGLAIAITVLGFNLLGDGLRDLFDPRQRKA